MKRLGLLFGLVFVPVMLGGQQPQPATPDARAPNPDAVDEGIPVTSDVVKQTQARCASQGRRHFPGRSSCGLRRHGAGQALDGRADRFACAAVAHLGAAALARLTATSLILSSR